MRAVLFVLSMLVPNAASALSCMPYNAVSAFKDAAKSADSYVAVLGRLTFDERKLPKVDWDRQQDVKPDNHLTGRIVGKSLTRSGFNAPFARDIDINVQCSGPWCAGLKSDIETLVFLKRDDGAYLLETNPCGGFAFGMPDNATLRKIEKCMRGEKCKTGLPSYN